MKIIIDADASPVVPIVEEVAKEYQIDLMIVSDINHFIQSEYGEVITVDAGFDQADHEIIKRVNQGDLVITQDYGLASLVLLKGAYALHQDGWFYTEKNIDGLLLQRQIGQKMRKAKKRYKQMPKRTQSVDDQFKQTLIDFLKKDATK